MANAATYFLVIGIGGWVAAALQSGQKLSLFRGFLREDVGRAGSIGYLVVLQREFPSHKNGITGCAAGW